MGRIEVTPPELESHLQQATSTAREPESLGLEVGGPYF